MNSELNTKINSLVDDSKEYVKLQAEDAKLRVVDRIAYTGGQLSNLLIGLFIAMCVVCMLLIAGSLYVGELVENTALGFLIMAGVATLLIWLTVGSKNKFINRPVANLIVKSLLEEREDEE